MKTRLGFVSNSSSSSFVVNKKYLTLYQQHEILHHAESGEDNAEEYPWSVHETEYTIEGFVYMDNFDMYGYMRKIGVDTSIVEWS